MQEEKTPGAEPNDQAQAAASVAPENQTQPDGGLPAAPCSPPVYIAPYTMIMGIESARESNRLFESLLDPLKGKSLSLLSFPPHCLLHYTSTKGESVPPESHLQAIRDMTDRYGLHNKEQLFVPLSVTLADGREMIGLWIHREHGSLTPVFLGRESESNPHSHPCIGVVDRNNLNQPSGESSTSTLSETESMISDISEREHRQLVGSGAYEEAWLSEENAQAQAAAAENANGEPRSKDGLPAAPCSADSPQYNKDEWAYINLMNSLDNQIAECNRIIEYCEREKKRIPKGEKAEYYNWAFKSRRSLFRNDCEKI